MFRIADIDHVVFRAIELERMRQFYCEVLGCTVEKRTDRLGFLQLRAGSCLIDLVSVDGKLGSRGGAAPAKEGHNVDHVCLRLENYNEAEILEHLKAHDVRIGEMGLRYGAEGEGPSIYLFDPEDNMIELKGPAVR